MTSDAGRSREFYSELFGWTAEEPSEEFGGYFMFTKDGAPLAGCMASAPGAPMAAADTWSTYLTTDDAEKTLEAVVENGGEVRVPAMAVADLGTSALVGDVSGAGIGIWQPGTFQGFSVFAETGTPSWFELHTRDYEASVGFYRDVFRWDTQTVSDTPEFRYTTLKDGTGAPDGFLAGIMDASGFLPEGVPSYWAVYFGVDDADAALAKATSLGGSIVMPAEDTPYGRLATATDPNGAQFKLVAPNEAMPARNSAG
jgi:predicted enzyme related to lactoylglutathione lyase